MTRTFDLPYGIACLPVPLAAWNFGTPKSFFSIPCQLVHVSVCWKAYFERMAERIPCFSSPCPGSVWLFVSPSFLLDVTNTNTYTLSASFPILATTGLMSSREVKAIEDDDVRVYG